jgi:hypothetical protein
MGDLAISRFITWLVLGNEGFNGVDYLALMGVGLAVSQWFVDRPVAKMFRNCCLFDVDVSE